MVIIRICQLGFTGLESRSRRSSSLAMLHPRRGTADLASILYNISILIWLLCLRRVKIRMGGGGRKFNRSLLAQIRSGELLTTCIKLSRGASERTRPRVNRKGDMLIETRSWECCFHYQRLKTGSIYPHLFRFMAVPFDSYSKWPKTSTFTPVPRMEDRGTKSTTTTSPACQLIPPRAPPFR